MEMERLVVAPLEQQDRAAFSCGKPALDGYLKTQAGQDRKRGLAQTFVLVHVERPLQIVGYYSLATLSVDLTSLPPEKARRIPYPAVPCILIGRLALDQSQQGKGLGVFLLDRALRHCLELSNQVGAYAVVVDAIDDQARSFYLSQGFRVLVGAENRLFLPIRDIERAIREAGSG